MNFPLSLGEGVYELPGTHSGSIAILTTCDIGTRSIFPVFNTITMAPPSMITRRTVDIDRSILVPSFSSMMSLVLGN